MYMDNLVNLALALAYLWLSYRHLRESHLEIIALIIIFLFFRYALIYQLSITPVIYQANKKDRSGFASLDSI